MPAIPTAMPERRFTEEEARRIFAAVAERQTHARADENGLTLAELQEVASASGLDPALVAAVATELSASVPEEVPTFFGAPLSVRQTRVVPVSVDDDTWATIVAELRREFGAPGVPTEMGRQREWTSTTTTGGTPAHLMLVPSDAGAVLTLEQTVAGQSQGAEWIVPGTVAPLAIIAALVHLSGKAGPEIYWLPGLIGIVTSIVLLGLWFMWRSWARRTETRFERVLDRVELIAREAARASGAVAPATQTPAPSLDLDALPDSPEVSDTAERRTRTGSQT